MSSTETTTPAVGAAHAAPPEGPRQGAEASAAAENSLDAALRAAEAAVALINNPTAPSSASAAAASSAAAATLLPPDEASRKLEALDAQLAADADSQETAAASPEGAASTPASTPSAAAPPVAGAGAGTADNSSPASALGDNSPVPVFAQPATAETPSGSTSTSDAGVATGSAATGPRENVAARSGRFVLQMLAAVNSPWHRLSASMRTLAVALTLGNFVTGGAAMGMAWMRLSAGGHAESAGHQGGSSGGDAHGTSDAVQSHEVNDADVHAPAAEGANGGGHENPATDALHESGSQGTATHEAAEPSHGAESTEH